MNYLKEALLGINEYFTVNKLLVICFGILLYEFFLHRRLSGLVKYGMASLLLLLMPFSSAVLLVIQKPFHSYGFVWSIVPVTALCAYAGVRFLWDMLPQMEQQGKARFIIGMLATLGILFLLGNQGQPQKVTQNEAAEREAYGLIAESLSSDTMLWGPRELMQWVRRRNGEVKLVYGMDMWDVGAAAYDGDPYEPDLVEAYEWMCSLEEFANIQEITKGSIVPVPESLIEGLKDAFRIIEASGVNTMVFPAEVYLCLAEWMPKGYQVQDVADYKILRRNVE